MSATLPLALVSVSRTIRSRWVYGNVSTRPVGLVYYPLTTPRSPGSVVAHDTWHVERCDVSLTKETTNTTHTQAERGSMTERREPHKISVKDTN